MRHRMQVDPIDALPERQQRIIRKHQANLYVELRPIFKDLGIALEFKDMPESLSGDSYYSEGMSTSGFVVRVNRNQDAKRRRFTGAHELGHCLLHADVIKATSNDPLLGSLNRSWEAEVCPFLGTRIIDPFVDRKEQDQEQEADEFAAAVLMPERAMNKAYRAGFRATIDLANVMGVSRGAILRRLRELKSN